MSVYTHVNRNIRPWSHQSTVAMVTKCHRSHPRKTARERGRKREVASQRVRKCHGWRKSVFMCTRERECFHERHVCRVYAVCDVYVLNVGWWTDSPRKARAARDIDVLICVCALACGFLSLLFCVYRYSIWNVCQESKEKNVWFYSKRYWQSICFFFL